MNDNGKKPKSHFKTNVLLKSIIGKDLINNDNIAVLELIKNSFDAGSSTANIYFHNIQVNDDGQNEAYSKKSSKIILKDSGRGMSEDDIRNKWLNIAYSEKKHKKEEGGRVLAGAKGIGRFSCDRLGKYLDIYSKKAGRPIVHLKIAWKDFEFEEGSQDTQDIQIQDIEVYVENISEAEFEKTGYSLGKSGTVIEISELRAIWDEDSLKKLRQYLERLLNPNQAFDTKRFTIVFHAPEFPPYLNGEIKNQIFEKLDFTTTVIESFISKDGKEITTNLRDKGRDVFTLIEKNSHNLLKDIKIVIYFLNTYSKIYFAKQTGLRVRDYGSIFLFKNGFRVSPYGDEGNDWLSLESRKGQGQRRFFGTRDIVGRIEINDPEGQFQEVSSREGLVQDVLFKNLINQKDGYFFDTLRRLEKYVVDGLEWDRVPPSVLQRIIANDSDFQKDLSPKTEEYILSQEEKNKSILRSISSILRTNPGSTIDLEINDDLISSLITDEHEKAARVIDDFEKYGESKLNSKTFKVLLGVKQKILKQEKEEAERKAKEAEKARKRAEEEAQKSEAARLEEENKRKQAEADLQQQVSQSLFYKSRISVDVQEMMLYHHDIGISAGTIENYLSVISNKIKKGKTISNDDLEKYIKSISLEVNKINAMANFATKANFNDASQKRKGDIVQFISEYLINVVGEAFRTIDHKDLQIDILNPTKTVLEISFIPMELMIMIDNLVRNSTKANSSRIWVEFIPFSDSQLEFKFRDNGDGIPQKNLPKIFDFGFTTTNGSGLGLYHVQDIVNKMKGEIRMIQPATKGSEFQIIFSK